MSEMLERLAKALGDVAYGYVDRATRPNTWDRSMALARAAVETLREPTDEMAFAGAAALANEMQAPSAVLMGVGYVAMINAIQEPRAE